MPFRDYFSDHSTLYASARPTYPDELFSFVASIAPAHERVWDCATGNGQAAIGLARHFADVEATDASEDQIARAKPCTGVRYSVQAAEQSAFPARSFDAVCVASALHWFDYSRFYPEVKRVLKPGGAFVAWGYDHLRVSPSFDEQFERSIGSVIAPYWPPRKQLLRDGYRDVPFPFERVQPPELKMRVEWSFAELMAFVLSWSGTQRCIAVQGEEFFNAAADALAPLWGDPEEIRECAMELFILAGRYAR